MTRNVSAASSTPCSTCNQDRSALARERWLLGLGVVRRAERAGGAAGPERQPPAARARDLRALSRRLQRGVSRLAARSRRSRTTARFPATGSPYTDARELEQLSVPPTRRSSIASSSTTARRSRRISASSSAAMRRSTGTSPAIVDAISHDAKQGLKLFVGKAGCVALPQHAAVVGRRLPRHRVADRYRTLSPHADPTENGRAFNQALICDPAVAGRRLQRQRPLQRRPRHARATATSAARPSRRVCGARRVFARSPRPRPYFRDGQAATLDDVIEFYDRGGDPTGTFLGGPKEIRPLHLAAHEKQQLREFLTTLTGQPIPTQFLRDLHNP